jgi:hypothetical protein
MSPKNLWPRWSLFIVVLIAAYLPGAPATGQLAVADDPIAAARRALAEDPIATARRAAASCPVTVVPDPIHAAQVLAAAEKTFPNLIAELENVELMRKAAADPGLRGNLRGRLAEMEWHKRNAKDGWWPSKKPNAPQNDFVRWNPDAGRLEGAQLKVHKDWRRYISSMKKDGKAERFVIPDDHYELVLEELKRREASAFKRGLAEEAAYYAKQQQRLTRMGRTFAELDNAIENTAKHLGRIAKTLRLAGKAASFVGIALALLDDGMAVYEYASGKTEVDALMARLGKSVVGGASAWAIGDLAATGALAAGATGAVPVAIAIVVGGVTYLAVDWAIDKVADSIRVGRLTAEDIKRLWPEGARGIPLDRLYQNAS